MAEFKINKKTGHVMPESFNGPDTVNRKPMISGYLAQKKADAKRLYVYKFLTAKQVSIKVNVTDKTVGVWVKKGNWKQLRDENADKRAGDAPYTSPASSSNFEDLRAYIEEKSPLLAKKINPIIDSYLKLFN